MNQFKFHLPALIILSFALIILSATQTKTIYINDNSNSDSEGFAVLELFTSQGCSSCPPADKLLGKYAALNNDHIIPLAFHVDYWNRLGWTDSFSSAKYSRRQRDYAMIIANSSVYTPQLIINGEKEFVGSDDDKISASVNNVVKTKAAVIISIERTDIKGKAVTVHYKLDKLQKNASINAALVQKQVFTNILNGENKGLKLINYNVVRDFNSDHINSQESGIVLNLPAGYDAKDFKIVFFVQDDASGKITGALQKQL